MIGRTMTYKSLDVLLRISHLSDLIMEFCISVWSPYYSKDKHLLERVQHRFDSPEWSRISSSYERRLEHLGLWSLEERRNRADLLQVFRMYTGWSVISFDSMFTFSDNTRTRGHSAKIAKNRCRLDVRRHERVIDRWNSLDQHVIDSTTVNAFKFFKEQEIHWSASLWTDGPPSLTYYGFSGSGAAGPGMYLVTPRSCPTPAVQDFRWWEAHHTRVDPFFEYPTLGLLACWCIFVNCL